MKLTNTTLQKENSGVTLIELMITVGVVAILGAIAYPTYTNYVTVARRADGAAAIMRLSSSLEKFKSNCGQYSKNIVGGSPNFPACSGLGLGVTGDLSPDGNYQLTVALDLDPATLAAIGYTISATPLGAQLKSDKQCANLTYTNQGVKGQTGPSPTAHCWKQ